MLDYLADAKSRRVYLNLLHRAIVVYSHHFRFLQKRQTGKYRARAARRRRRVWKRRGSAWAKCTPHFNLKGGPGLRPSAEKIVFREFSLPSSRGESQTRDGRKRHSGLFCLKGEHRQKLIFGIERNFSNRSTTEKFRWYRRIRFFRCSNFN